MFIQEKFVLHHSLYMYEIVVDLMQFIRLTLKHIVFNRFNRSVEQEKGLKGSSVA